MVVAAKAFAPLNRVTVRDLFAGGLALVGLAGIVALLALSHTVPAELWALETLIVGYVIRGAENGGLRPKGGNGP